MPREIVEVGVLPLFVAKKVAERLVLGPERLAHAATPQTVTDIGPPLVSKAAERKASDVALEVSRTVKHEVSPPAVVLASALASELGSKKPIAEKVAYAKAIVAHAEAAGKRPFAYLTPRGVLGRAGKGGRILSTDKSPTYEDVAIAERVLGRMI